MNLIELPRCILKTAEVEILAGHRVDGEGYWVVCGTVELSVDHLLDKGNGVIHHPMDLQQAHTQTHTINYLNNK